MEQKRKEIGNTTYLVTQMGGERALKTQTMLIGILGEGVFSVINKGKLSKEDIPPLLEKIMEKFDDEKVNNFVLSLFKSGVMLEKMGKDDWGNEIPIKAPLDFNTHFSGKSMDIWKVAGFILEANFALGK